MQQPAAPAPTGATRPSPDSPAPSFVPPAAARLIERFFTRRVVRWIGVAATIGMFLVLSLGVVVTTTHSGHGCGGTWPLCRGQFLPDDAISTAIEYTHRMITGVEGLLILALTLGALYYWRGRREIRLLAPLMVVFLIIQSALGAVVALTNEAAELRAMHFGVSLIAFVSILLTTDIVLADNRYDRLRDRPVPQGFRRLVWGLTVYTLVVVYTGAYLQYRGAQLACTDWPLCHGQLVPSLAGGTGFVFVHRFAALLLTAGTLWLYWWARELRTRRPDLYWGSLAALAGVLLQALEGALVVSTKLGLASEIGHGAVVTLYFGALCYLALHVTPRQRELRSVVKPRPATPRKAASVASTQP